VLLEHPILPWQHLLPRLRDLQQAQQQRQRQLLHLQHRSRRVLNKRVAKRQQQQRMLLSLNKHNSTQAHLQGGHARVRSAAGVRLPPRLRGHGPRGVALALVGVLKRHRSLEEVQLNPPLKCTKVKARQLLLQQHLEPHTLLHPQKQVPHLQAGRETQWVTRTRYFLMLHSMVTPTQQHRLLPLLFRYLMHSKVVLRQPHTRQQVVSRQRQARQHL